MQQNPAQRFQSAEAMRTALQHCLPNFAPPTTVQIPAVASSNATVLVQSSGLICPKCGFQNRPGAKFCKRDKQPLLHGATTVPPQPRVPLPAPRQPIHARPVAVSTPPTDDPTTAYQLDLQYLNNKNFAESINQFKRALAFGNPSYDVLYNLGRAYRQYGQSAREKDRKLFTDNFRLAAEQFEEAIRLKPDALDALFQLGMCYRDMDLYPQSAATFKKAQQLSPREPAIYYQLGMVAVEQGSRGEAEKYL